jgi:hypothetical protein
MGITPTVTGVRASLPAGAEESEPAEQALRAMTDAAANPIMSIFFMSLHCVVLRVVLLWCWGVRLINDNTNC